MITGISVNEKLAFDRATKEFIKTELCLRYQGKIPLSPDKINVIVGPTGSGKSSLLSLMAAASFSLLDGRSTARMKLSTCAAEKFFGTDPDVSYYTSKLFLQGFKLEGSINSALYYRPGFMYGLEPDICHAMMMGYPSKHLISSLNQVSSGQYAEFWLSEIETNLGRISLEKERPPESSTKYQEKNRLSVKERWESLFDSSQKSLILLDEPETSLDAKQQLMLWNSLLRFQAEGHQVVMATHHFSPFIGNPNFAFVETEPGYVIQTQDLLSSWF